MINYEQFKQVDLKVAKVLLAERVEGSEKLIKLQISLGEEERQIIAGIGLKYQPEDLVGKNIIIVANLESRILMGLESQGMLLAASNENEGPILLTIMEDIASGSEIR
ncbi:MAG: methionine--tRNA ligase subunit beta [Candidatus Paceibacterota bacterium]|jgi:methionyl-tRNA synthetase